ncbi:MAG: P-loop NTPase [Candidatus Woesearchaeota archaeon]|nr:P-loop NTPase [Candidatus Woesearchaeota archaeon]
MKLEPVDPKGEDEFSRLTYEMDQKRKQEMALDTVKKVIGIHSGKGGVGKTFLTVNLAYALAEKGHDVAILDADVDCPNVPKFLGITSSLFVDKEKKFVPVNHNGVKIVSMGLTKEDEAEPILIRGPAKHRVAIDFLANTAWGAVDYLLVDLPPGTSDVPMSLLEFGNVDGILYITTPQKDALMDTRKSIRLGKTFAIPMLGIVENMSGSVFGKDKALELSKEFGIPYLGSIPLSEKIVAANDRGDIIFSDVAFESVVRPILNAITTQ